MYAVIQPTTPLLCRVSRKYTTLKTIFSQPIFQPSLNPPRHFDEFASLNSPLFILKKK